MSPHPRFDRVIHEPNRLQICAVLTPRPSVEFAELRDELGLADASLSKHLKALETAGYVALRKAPADGRIRTSVAITPAGREAVCGHVSELQRLARVISPRQRRR
jgi:DNA-binding MarR family transcriptional regulator